MPEMSTEKIYDLVNKMSDTLSAKIDRVDTSVRILTQSFNDLEAGRLSALEKSFAILDANVRAKEESQNRETKIREDNVKPYANFFWEIVKYIAIAILAALLATILKDKIG